jgi:hypothetical protein
MPLCLALFFCRTVFIGYKYLFFLLIVPCVVYSAYWLFKNGFEKSKWRKLLLPLLIIASFFAHFSPLSNVVKETVNLLLILYFVAFADLYYEGDKTESLLKWILLLTMLAGVIAVVRFGLTMLGVHIPLSDKLFEGEGFTLVNDCNFYSLFFIFSIIISTWLLFNKPFSILHFLVANILSFINIAAAMSRRAYLLCVLIVTSLGIIVNIKRTEYKWGRVLNMSLMLTFIMIVFVAVVFSTRIYTPDMSINSKKRYYKISSIFDNSISFEEYDIRQQRKYYKKDRIDSNNLFYNGDLLAGMKCWRTDRREPINVSWHNDEAEPYIRIEKIHSDRWWSLIYSGRPIFYKSGVDYTYSFKYRIIQGEGIPFRVGLWVKESSGYIEDLKKEITPSDSVWNNCVVRHVFEKDQLNPTCFLNAQLPNTIIDVKDIRLTCDDNLGVPYYVDQLPDSVIHNYFSQDTINYLTHTRTDRWRYALELWQTRYDTKQKIFGQGFKYLKWYGEKFYGNPDRHDFPHNPIISSFLYSGIIGGVVYIIFLIMSLWLYWKKRKQLGIFFIMYLCCMFFCMFSGSSHFSFPLFAFLSFLPFVEKVDNAKSELQTD